jgi:ubiquinone/menaquinone biosynthesis C-methylase UbiE
MRNTIFIALLFSTTITLAQDQWKNVYSESAWAERDQWQRADDLIHFLKINKASHVADIGCHEGYMSFKLSKIVGDPGKVFAVDVEQNKLDKLKNHIVQRKVSNIQLVKAEYDNPKLDTNSLDAVLILDAYHEMDDHDKILQHIKAALKQGGRLLICEPIADIRRGAKRSVQEGKHELGMNFAVEDLKKAGFKILVNEDNFINREKEKGDKMWVIVASSD